MDSIAEFVNPAAAVAPDTSIESARMLLTQAPDRHGLAVVVAGRPVGLVSREVCLAADAGQAVRAVMDPEPLVIDGAVEVLEACRLVAQHQHRTGADGFIVCDNGRYLGAASLRSVLEGLRGGRGDPVTQTIAAAEHAEQAGAPFKREFLDLVSQELRAPLDGVLAMTECLERQPLGADAQSHVRAIRESGETLQRLLAAAVDLTRAQHGLLKLASGPLVLRSLIDDIQQDWMDQAARDGVTLLASFDGDSDLSGFTDGAQLRRVFDCLIQAALRHARAGAIEVGLKTSQDRDGVHIEGRVRDTGPGLPPDQLARLFEPRAGADAGGLGVALAREIVLGLNGCIRAESNAGAGVSMIFNLLCEPAPQAGERSPHAESGASGAAHVLVVDDNATNRMVAEALCEMFDCTSECAADGVEAVEIARSGRFDVILMDIKMPRMDGMAATRAIRALPGAAASVPIIALTANVDPEDARAYLACGMCSVVEKPIKPDRLLAAINEALAANAQRQVAAA
jgi:signal transduction histidine kinase/CheY-like chemotaxis protein